MTNPPVQRDERTLAVENAGYRWAWYTVSYGLLGIVAYRAFFRGEHPWDLLALVVLSGAVHMAYQVRGRVVYPRRLVLSFVALLLAGLLAATLVVFRQ